ncbi:MAG: 2-phospho-L-lactate transferase [Proteobacteria bacterium]|nr:2-phospho-L-lactate transferase [Pseudomonadota bacterium]HQR03573.1 2-phospho-L-lactate transferase [Rhodocyclaceae bacterium]
MSGPRVVAISGGVGGAKLALGFYRVLPPDSLAVIVNTGDDFTHLGLHVSPDVDTLLYTLGGLANPDLGWGRKEETWAFMRALAHLGGDTWFRLGDADLALHVERTRRLARGESLSQVTAAVARRFEIAAEVLPMSDDAVRTRVSTDAGVLDFQEYFVGRQCRPVVNALNFDGAAQARPGSGIVTALSSPEIEAIVICPSNPYLSIAPILALPGLVELLRRSKAPVIAVSPLVGGQAVKGPTAKIMAEMEIPVSPESVVRHYQGVIDGFVLDERDAAAAGAIEGCGVPVRIADTLMNTLRDKERLAETCLAFAAGWAPA